MLATAGDLVFQGTPGGEFAAYDAATGTKLWSTQAQTGVVAGPMTYDGEQYVAVSVGWGAVFKLVAPGNQVAKSRVLVFKRGAAAALPEPEEVAADWPAPPELTGSEDELAAGREVYLSRCWTCHGDAGMSGGVLPDLRKVAPETQQAWDSIVLEGALESRGMPRFDHPITSAQSEAVRQYVIKRAIDTRPAQ